MVFVYGFIYASICVVLLICFQKFVKPTKVRKKPVINKTQTNIIDKYYTREDRLIEANRLIKHHGAWTFNTAKEAIDSRMTLVRKTMHADSFEYNCPVCRCKNYKLDFTSPRVSCRCPSREKIQAIYQETWTSKRESE